MLKGRGLIYSLIMLALAMPEIGVDARAQERTAPTVDIASLADKSMGEVIKTLGKPRYCMEFEAKEIKSRIPPGTPSFDDACFFIIGRDPLTVYSWRGRAVAFLHTFGNYRKRSTKPEDALRRLGIDVGDAKPSQILKNPTERPFINIQDSAIPRAISGRMQHIQDVIWSGRFNEKKWKEIRVTQNEDDKRCPIAIAILDYNAQQ
jgi:hypothetical protein